MQNLKTEIFSKELEQLFEGDYSDLIRKKKILIPRVIILQLENNFNRDVRVENILAPQQGIELTVLNKDFTYNEFLNILIFSDFDTQVVYLHSTPEQIGKQVVIEYLNENGTMMTIPITPMMDAMSDEICSFITLSIPVRAFTNISTVIRANTTLTVSLHTKQKDKHDFEY